MTQSANSVASEVADYLSGESHLPLFVCGDCLPILKALPDECIDFCMTSPPYWNQREYAEAGIGLEDEYHAYIRHLLDVFWEVRRVLKPTGSFWLNLGDAYQHKGLLGLPWRIAIALMDEQGWILRNDVVWNKIKGPDHTIDKLRNVHEYIFHFVRQPKGYHYDADAIRSRPRAAYVRNGAVVSATGVTGVRYRRQIELSTALTPEERAAALAALDDELAKVARGEIADFRMVIRSPQQAAHAEVDGLSGYAKELAQRGYYFVRYDPNGSKPADVWDIMPEDTANRDEQHYAAYPEDVCKIPLLATCPESGIALDPFCGTGTTNLVAMQLFRKSVGIDISPQVIDIARQRCFRLL